jgi:hypothetical protein
MLTIHIHSHGHTVTCVDCTLCIYFCAGDTVRLSFFFSLGTFFISLLFNAQFVCSQFTKNYKDDSSFTAMQ